jgi:polyisoprenoid-binding protein YceI
MRHKFAIHLLAFVTVLVLGAFSLSTGETERPESIPGIQSVTQATSSWEVDRSHSQIGFKVRHLGIANVRGAFNEFEVTMQFDPADLTSLQVETAIDANSIDTGNERRDDHLRSDDFFNVEQFPALTFISKEVRNAEGDAFELVGDLTIRDVTKEVVLEAEFFGAVTQRNGRKAGFEAVATINRFDYGLKWDRVTEASGLVVGENVEIILELEMQEVVAD